MKYTKNKIQDSHIQPRLAKVVHSFLSNLLFLIAVGFFNPALAQQRGEGHNEGNNPPSPVIVESLIGNTGVNLETVFSKKFTPGSRFGVFGIVDLYGVYKANEQSFKNENMSQTQLTYRIVKGLDVSAGAFFEKHLGFRPTAGLQYNLFAGDFHLLVAPRIDLSQTYNGELLGFVEYTPKISNDWRLYSRAEGLYNRDLKNDIHSISYVWGRLGVSYKTYRFGVGANFNSFGPTKMKENNYGLFAGVLLF
ncbi:MAG: hypothetical protein B6D37_09555 [Sphingobacteriales bacterium UTBCD1]|jgi:hypothetical protein|nr:MAG: hypothetical protein B6D37_09555 [Sphingobacteriales bacterium UTBCD1]